MAEILLTGIEMPKGEDDVKLIINSDGSVHRIIGWAISEKLEAKAIEVPPHGRLGDVAKFVEDIINSKTLKYEFTTLLRQLAKNAPIVIEASI